MFGRIFIFAIFLGALAIQCQARDQQIPPAVQQIIDKIGQGGTPTPAEQKTLTDWGESLSKPSGLNENVGDNQNKKKADDDGWHGTVTIEESSHSESDKTEVFRPIEGSEECSFSQRSVSRRGDKKSTTYSDFQLLPDSGEEETHAWLGTARTNVTVNKTYYTLDVHKNAQCGVTPPDTDEQGYETTTSGNGVGQGDVRFGRYVEEGSSQATCTIEASAEKEVSQVPEVGRRWSSKGEESIKQWYSLFAGQGNDISFQCDPAATSYSGQQKKQTSPNANDIEVISWNIQRGPLKANAVAINGCAHLAKGGKTQLTAKGKPPGGTYSWRVDPSGILAVSGDDEDAMVTGETPGRATIEVGYRSPDGKISRGTLAGSVAEIRSVNGGAKIPQIGLRDENGKEAPPVRIPVNQVPPEGDLLSFPVADEGIATVRNDGKELLIQGLRIGRTTAQAQTLCREKTGAAIHLDVVRCTKETIDKMMEKEHKVLDRFNKKARKARELVSHPEVKEAADQIWKHGGEAVLKTADVILSGATAAGEASHAVHTLEKIVSVSDAVPTAFNASQGSLEAVMLTGSLLNPVTKAMATAYEFTKSWHEWMSDVKKIVSTTDEVQELLAKCERDREELEFLADKRKKICGQGPTDTDNPPATTTPSKSTPPKHPEQTANENATEPSEQPSDTQPEPFEPPIISDPEPPAQPSRGGGFIMPTECGCGSYVSSAWDSNATGLKVMGADLARTDKCAEPFGASLQAYNQDLKTLIDAANQAQQALSLPQQEGLPKLKAAVGEMKKSVEKIQAFGKSVESVKTALGGCEETFKKAGELVIKAPEQEQNAIMKLEVK